MAAAPVRVEVCLGSSCFARGSQRIAEAAAAWISAHPGTAALAGHRCQGRCGQGLRLGVDGREVAVCGPADVPAAIASVLGDRP